MVSAWAWVILAGATGNGAAFDPKDYIKQLPAEVEETFEGDADPAPANASAVATEGGVRQADVTVAGKDKVALRSAFGTIYVPKSPGITVRALASASCASREPAPSVVSPDRPLDQASQALEADIIKTIERRCRSAAKGSKAP